MRQAKLFFLPTAVFSVKESPKRLACALLVQAIADSIFIGKLVLYTERAVALRCELSLLGGQQSNRLLSKMLSNCLLGIVYAPIVQ